MIFPACTLMYIYKWSALIKILLKREHTFSSLKAFRYLWSARRNAYILTKFAIFHVIETIPILNFAVTFSLSINTILIHKKEINYKEMKNIELSMKLTDIRLKEIIKFKLNMRFFYVKDYSFLPKTPKCLIIHI